MIVPTFRSLPENICYFSGVVVTRGSDDLHMSVINYWPERSGSDLDELPHEIVRWSRR